jgi:CHRD domain
VSQPTGDRVVPGPGDPDGSGEVVLQMRPPTRKSKKAHACAFLYLDRVEEPFKVRVHKGRKGETGPVQFSVAVEAHDPPRQDLDASGCRFDLSSRQINAVRRHERRYYAEVHTAELPDGAIRGQLRQYTDRSEPK